MIDALDNFLARRFLSVVLLVSLVVTVNCRTEREDAVSNRDIKTVMETHARDLMSIPGVTAVAIGQLTDGTPCIKIYVAEKTEALMDKLPDKIEGFPVVVEESGEFKPMESD